MTEVAKLIEGMNKAVQHRKAALLMAQKIEQLLKSVDYSVEKKKQQLMQKFTASVIQSFAVDRGKISDADLLMALKHNVPLLRAIARKLIHLNYYLSTTFIADIASIDKNTIPNELLGEKEFPIRKQELEALEHTVYELLEKIIIFDNKLLGKFERKEHVLIKEEKIEAKDMSTLIKKQTELLYHLDAKLPPAAQLNEKIIKKTVFDYWIATILALVAKLNHEYSTEVRIFKELKQHELIKAKIDMKIRHIMKEKSNVLQLKEGRILMADNLHKMDDEWKEQSMAWHAVADL